MLNRHILKVPNNMKVGVTTVNFCANKFLIDVLKSTGYEIKLNPFGRRLTTEELISFLSDCDASIIGLDKIDSSILRHLPKLKKISKYGVGLDNINLEACAKKNIKVHFTPGVNKRSVSELTLAMILSLLRNMYTGSVELKSGNWVKNGGFELTGKKIGIVGFGNIGKDLVELLNPFKTEIYVTDINSGTYAGYETSINITSFDQILKDCDIVTFHVPLTKETKNMLNSNNISLMKKGVIIINTARGGIIDEEAIIKAFEDGKIGGLGIDAYEIEPPLGSQLLKLKNTICTPHIGGNSDKAVKDMGLAAIKALSL